MAVKDVKKYYDQIMSQYLELQKDVMDFDKELKEGHVEQWQFDQAQSMLFRITDNVNRWTYMMKLLYQPTKKSKIKKYKKEDQIIYDQCEHFSAENIIQENIDGLHKFRMFLKEIKEKIKTDE